MNIKVAVTKCEEIKQGYFVSYLQVTFAYERTLKVVLSTKNFKAKNEFSELFQGKARAEEFSAAWARATTLDPNKGHRVAAGENK